jgi:hypothetical protein
MLGPPPSTPLSSHVLVRLAKGSLHLFSVEMAFSSAGVILVVEHSALSWVMMRRRPVRTELTACFQGSVRDRDGTCRHDASVNGQLQCCYKLYCY